MRRLRAPINRIPVLVAVLVFVAASQSLAVTVQQEIDLGRKINAEILSQMPASKDTAAQKEMDELGQRLAKHVRRPEIPYHFTILDEGTDLDAFSIPGGYIYFSQRMWDTLRTDERTGVLGHEIGHVDRRHALDAYSKARKRQIVSAVLLTIIGASAAWANVADVANQMYTLKFSRADERQADELSVDLSRKAGDNPAGILLALRKIQRFELERGGMPPRILATHPPTNARITHISQLLTSMGLPVPVEQINPPVDSNMVGTVSAVTGRIVQFTSSKQLNSGDVVWLMSPGWDYRYESRINAPVARGIVRTVGSAYTADITPLAGAKKGIANGTVVCAPPVPPPSEGIGTCAAPSIPGTQPAIMIPTGKPAKMDRLLARQSVWDQPSSRVTYEATAYLVVTDPADPAGYLALTRDKYSYCPVSAGAVLVKVDDPESARWVGPVISIGRSGQTMEILANRALNADAVYEVSYPAWNPKDGYRDRIVGRARLLSGTGKIVLKMSGFNPGWDMAGVQNGFDVYETPVAK